MKTYPKIFQIVLISLVAILIFSMGTYTEATIFPYIKVAGPGSDLSAADDQWAAKHWDLTSTRMQQVGDFKQFNPDMKVIAYAALSFFDTASGNKNWQAWLKYCHPNDIDPDVGLTHYKKNVDVSIGSGNLRPREDRFSKIYTPSGEVSRKAYGDENPGDITLPATIGQAVYFAMETRFKEINFNLGSGSSGGWQAKYQYWNGASWIDLTPTSDTTNMLQQSGKVEFMPPPTTANWKKATEQQFGLGTDDVPFYWLRLFITSSGTAPVVHSTLYTPPTATGQKGIWAQDYITGPDTGSGAMTVPGWDASNDTDGDGVWDTNNNPNATATFKYQSRAALWQWYRPQWISNPGNSVFRNWVTQWNKENISDLQDCDGLFIDVQNSRMPDFYGMTHPDDPVYIEYETAREGGQWETDLASLAVLQEDVLTDPDFTMGNIPAWDSPWWSESLINAHKAEFFEFFIQITGIHSTYGSDWWINNFGTGYTKTWAVDMGKMIRIMWTRNSAIDFERDSTFGLAVYLQMKQDNTYYDPGDPMLDPDRYWSKLIEWVGGKDVDTGNPYPGVGNPLSDTYQWATGADPAAPTRTYYVFAREYQNVLVLVKPKPRYDSSLGDDSATTHQLGASYRPLHADGTSGSATTSISLRNGEAAILVKETTPPPTNNPPVANDQAISTDEDTPINIILTASDSDGDSLTYSVVANPSHGNLSGTPPNLTYTPQANYNGADSFTFKANDGKVDSNVATVSITINPVNDVPVLASIGNKTIDEGILLEFTISAQDVDGDILSYSATNIPTGATFTNQNFSWTPTFEQAGNYNITFTVDDGKGGIDSETITINVNNAPTIPGIPVPSLNPNQGTFTLNWTASSDTNGIAYYELQRSSDNGLTFTTIVNPTTNSYSEVGLAPGTYLYRVRAVDGVGKKSAFSAIFPRGIYALDGSEGTYRDGRIRNYDFVEGYAWRMGWSDFEIAEGVYDFSAIDYIISRLEPIGKKLTIISLLDPDYITTAPGVTTWTYIDPVRGNLIVRAVPWDTYLLQRFRAFIKALGDHLVPAGGVPTPLRDHPVLANFHLGIPGLGPIREAGFEISDIPGYTRQNLLDAIKTSLHVATDEFPNKFVSVGFWRVTDANSSPELWEEIRTMILNEFDGVENPKVGFFQDNLAASKALNTGVITGYPSTSFAQPLYLSKDSTYIMFQTLQSWRNPFANPDKTANTTPSDALQYAYDTFNSTYFELYVPDLDYPEYQPSLAGWNSHCVNLAFVIVLAPVNKPRFAADLSQVRAYPNPYRGDKHSQIIFDNLTANVRIRIYTLGGELVKEISEQEGDKAYWDVKNKQGEAVSSGIYIYYITNPKGQEKKGKVAIIK